MLDYSSWKFYNYKDLQGTQYIELASVPSNEKIQIWGKNSLYFSDTVFSFLFSYPLHNTIKKYNLFGFAELSLDEQTKFIEELSKNYQDIMKLRSYIDVIKFSKRPGNEFRFEDMIPKNDQEILKIIEAMKCLNILVYKFVESSINNEHVLAILGL